RIAEEAVERRHGAGSDAAPEAVAHHERVALAQAREEGAEVGEVVAVVGVAEDHVAAPRGADAAMERAAVAALGHLHHARAQPLGDVLRAVAAAVVGHDDLAGDAARREEAPRLLDAGAERLGLVEARHHDRQLGRVGAHGEGGSLPCGAKLGPVTVRPSRTSASDTPSGSALAPACSPAPGAAGYGRRSS